MTTEEYIKQSVLPVAKQEDDILSVSNVNIAIDYDIVFDVMKQAHVNENTIRIIKEIIYINLIKNSYDRRTKR